MSLIRTLPHHCGACNSALTIEYELSGERGGRYRLQKWQCPNCGVPNALNLAGRILSVTKRGLDGA